MNARILVLLVDDDKQICSLLNRALAKSEFEVVGLASTGAECLDLARQFRPDFIVLDRELPDDRTFRTLRVLHGDLPNSRIIVFSGDANEELVAEAISLGASGYLEKGGPIHVNLLRTLRSLATNPLPIDIP